MPEPPAAVEAAKEDWRRGVDVILKYACDNLVPVDPSSAPPPGTPGVSSATNVWSPELYDHFAKWLKANGQTVWSDQLFTARFEEHPRIKARGVTKKRLFKSTYGLRLSRIPVWSASNGWAQPPDKYMAWLGVRFRDPNDTFDAYGKNGW